MSEHTEGTEQELAIRRWCGDCDLKVQFKEMENKVTTMQLEQTKVLAVLGFWKWALPIMVAIAVFLGGVVERRLMASQVVQPQAQVQGK